jgi:hypothetical protein
MGLLNRIRQLFGSTQLPQVKKNTSNHIERTLSPIPSENTHSSSIPERLMSSIPKDILNLLWFYDGFNKNCDTEDPSGISLTWPISMDKPDPLPYYPSYHDMTPEQRGTYINWLTNISTPIDIGYVFVFFYGLERQIAIGNVDKAVQVIAQLKQEHSQSSFDYYSDNALVFAALLKQDPSILRFINPETANPINLILSKGFLSGSLSAVDIVHISKSIGWDNQRYIKLVPEKFIANLSSILITKYGKNVYPIPNDLSDVPIVKIPLANLCLGDKKYNKGPISISSNGALSIEIPDFSSTPKIRTQLLMILKTAHDNTKAQIGRERKSQYIKTNSVPVKQTVKNINVNTGWPMAKQSSIDREIINYKDILHFHPAEKPTIYSTDSDEIKKMKFRIYEESKRSDKFLPSYHEGLIAYKRGEWEQAERLWMSVIKFNPPIVAEKMAIMLRKEKRFKDEIAILKIGIKYSNESDFIDMTDNPMLTSRLAKAESFYNNHKDQDNSKGITE